MRTGTLRRAIVGGHGAPGLRAGAVGVVAVAFVALLPPAASLQQPTLAGVLSEAAASVTAFADTTRIIACEERYKQNLLRHRVVLAQPELGYELKSSQYEMVGADNREWVAELALAATPANEPLGFPWMEFRDIVSVRGKPLRDGRSRLGMLATQPLDLAGPEAVAITLDAAGLMLGRFVRAIDLPRLALVFLHAANQPRFEFSRGGDDRVIDGVKTWEVKYRETTSPSIVRASGGGDAPSTGSFWIDPATGRVRMSVLKSADSSNVHDELTVTYRPNPAIGLCLPVQLKETIVDNDAEQRVDATATFTKWRILPRTAGIVRVP